MSRLTFQQKKLLWKINEADPDSLAGKLLIQPSHVVLAEKLPGEIFALYKNSFNWLKLLQSSNWNPKRITMHLVDLAEIWGYINSGVTLLPAFDQPKRFVDEVSRVIFTAIHFSPDCMSDDSNILHPMFLNHPSLIVETHEILTLLRQCRSAGKEFWDPIVKESGEELIRVFDLTFGNSELSSNLDRRLITLRLN